MPQKIIFYYNQGSRGWQEVWYSNEDTLPVELPKNWNTMLTNAIAFRAAGTVLYGVKVSDEDLARKSILFLTGEKYKIQNPAAGTFSPDICSTDAQYRLSTNSGNHRFLSLRGLRDADVQRTIAGNDAPSAALTEQVDKYLEAVRSRGFTIRSQKVPPDVGVSKLQIASIFADPGDANASYILCKNAVALSVGSGDKVSFSGIPTNDLLGFPRTTVTLTWDPLNPLRTYIPYRLRGYDSFQPLKMFGMLRRYKYQAIADWGFMRFSERKTGRPFGSLRGASRPKARAI